VCSGCICTPRAENKKISGVIYGKICKCTPRQSKSQFLGHFCWAGEIWKVGVVNLVVLACVLRAMSKKVVNSFEEKSVPPQKKSWLCLCSIASTHYSGHYNVAKDQGKPSNTWTGNLGKEMWMIQMNKAEGDSIRQTG